MAVFSIKYANWWLSNYSNDCAIDLKDVCIICVHQLTETRECSTTFCIFVQCVSSQNKHPLQSYLNEKSNCNLLAAQLLHEHQRYAAVPHCAYYACLQQIKYVLCVKFNKYCDDNELSGKNTHVVIWNEFWRQTKLLNSELQLLTYAELVIIKNNFDNLKTGRVISDYSHENRVDFLLSKESINLAFEFFHIIEKIFHD